MCQNVHRLTISAWRRRAIEACPDLQPEFENPSTTIYDVFFELLPRVHTAHSRGDIEELRRIYAFAEWCMQQNEEYLWNAAGVAFYEHLVDNVNTFSGISRWVSPGVFKAVCAWTNVKRVHPWRDKQHGVLKTSPQELLARSHDFETG